MRTGLAQAAWWWRHAGVPQSAGVGSSLTPDPFPRARLPLAVDLFMFGNWVDISAYVYQRDRVAVARGRSSEAGTADPTSIRLTLNNRDGRFSPRNPTGPYYGQIGRNTPLRVRVGGDVRAVGEVVAWPPRWDLTGGDVWVPVEAAGVLRRLQQGATPLRSTQYRFITSGAADLFSHVPTQPVAYWPCEDGADSETIASALGGPPMAVAGGPPEFAANTDFAGSDSLPVLGSSAWTGPVPGYAGTGTIHVRFLMSVPAAGATNGAVICRILCTGTAPRWDMVYNTGGQFTLNAYDAAGGLLLTSGPTPLDPVNGFPVQMKFELAQSGLDVTWIIGTQTVATVNASTIMGTTLAGNTVSRATQILIDPNRNLADTAIGHVVVWSSTAVSDLSRANPISGYVGETAGTRISRLCAEEGIDYLRVLPSHASQPMGAQRPAQLVDLLRECEAADQGVLFEPRSFLGLSFADRQGLYNQAAAVTLDYAASDLSQFEPTDDDLLVRNDWTVTRSGGSSARAQLAAGALSVQAPPDGVGRYDSAATVNVQVDGALPDQAGWRVHLGTVDEPRFPQVGVDLARVNFPDGGPLAAAVAALDVGQLAVVVNPPAWLPAGDAEQLAVGFTETLNAFERTVVVNCVPAAPWTVGVYDDTGGRRYTSDGSTLAAEVAAGMTSLTVATAAGPLWSTTDGAFDVLVSGERCTVTAVVGGSSPQTFTVVRAVNGVAKTLPAAAAVELAQPAVYAL